MDLAKLGYNQGMLNWTGNSVGTATFEWYDCDSNSIIPMITSNIFFPKRNGSYAIIATDLGNGCIDTSDCITINDIGLLELNLFDQLNIYPNPVNNILHVDYPSHNSYQITIADVAGRTVLHPRNSRLIDMNVLPKGVYLLKIEENGASTVRKIIKE